MFDRVVYVPGSINNLDELMPNGLTRFGGYSVEEFQKRYPGAQVMTWEEALPMIESATNEKFKTAPQKITEERYWEMLEVLPPKQWVQTGRTASFKLSEMTCGDLGLIFCRIGADYWEFTDSHRLTHDQIVDLCSKA